MESFFFCAKVMSCISWQSICYALGRPRTTCVQNVAYCLTSDNVMCTKILQAISVGIDFFTEEERKFLSLFADSVPFVESELPDIKEIVSELSIVTSQELTLLEPVTPTRSGTIAVVYYGKLDGKEVVIKVKRKGVESTYQEGVRKMRTLAKITSWLPYIRMLRLQDIMEENEVDMLDQIDFVQEVNNCIRSYKNFKRVETVKIPHVYDQFTSHNNDIIVMERLRGVSLHELSPDKRTLYAAINAKYFMKSVLYDGFYHADMHQGNLFFTEENGKPVLGVVDFGMCGSIRPEEQESFYRFFQQGWFKKDPMRAAEVMFDCLVRPQERIRMLPEAERQRLIQSLSIITGEIFHDHSDFDPSTIYRVNNILRPYDLRLSRQFCKIQLALGVSAGVGKSLAVETPLMQTLDNVINEMFICSDILAEL